MTKMKKILAGLYVGIMYVIVITYMTSCTNHRRRDGEPKTRTEQGELTLYLPNGNDTTFTVSNVNFIQDSERIIYYDMDGSRYYTSMVYNYRRYLK
jgi:hypothetical protein